MPPAAVVLAAVGVLESFGWELLGTIDVSKKHVSSDDSSYKIDTSSYFFVRSPVSVAAAGRYLLSQALSNSAKA